MNKEEYINQNSINIEPMPYEWKEWSEPKYECPKCGGPVRKNLLMVHPSNPPRYTYKCDKCGKVDYLSF